MNTLIKEGIVEYYSNPVAVHSATDLLDLMDEIGAKIRPFEHGWLEGKVINDPEFPGKAIQAFRGMSVREKWIVSRAHAPLHVLEGALRLDVLWDEYIQATEEAGGFLWVSREGFRIKALMDLSGGNEEAIRDHRDVLLSLLDDWMYRGVGLYHGGCRFLGELKDSLKSQRSDSDSKALLGRRASAVWGALRKALPKAKDWQLERISPALTLLALKANRGFFLKEARKFGWGEEGLFGNILFNDLAIITAAMGKDAPAIMQWVREEQMDLHWAANQLIQLVEVTTTKEDRRYILKSGAKGLALSACIVKQIKFLNAIGWRYGMKRTEAEEALLSMEYDIEWAVKEDLPLLKECARFGYSQEEAEWILRQWRQRGDVAGSHIPDISLSKEGIRLIKLDKEDPRALFAGDYTGCCQHPGGQASSAAWHSVTSENGCVYVWMRGESILAQAWVWRNGDLICFDNIEAGKIKEDKETMAVIRNLFLEAAALFKAEEGIERVFLGKGYSSLRMKGTSIRNPVKTPKGVYTDAKSGWLV